jgi:hypothetical protein
MSDLSIMRRESAREVPPQIVIKSLSKCARSREIAILE